MKVAIVVQRYGAEINGGAELHARYVAEHLARHVKVEVLTTCAKDYVTWRNQWREGTETVNGIAVRRFPVTRERDPKEFAVWSERVFTQPHALRDELAWLEAEGPTSPALVSFIRAHEADYDFFVFFSFRYYHSFYGCRAVPRKAILVPTAERDGALGLGIFPPVFRGIRAFMYNSFEERALIQRLSNNADVPGVVVGVGSEIPARTNPARFRQKYGLRDRFAIYVGRIDENKGCRELFEFFEHYTTALNDGLHLVLIGQAIIEVPKHPRIHHLGFVDDADKFDGMAAAELLVMPSYFESLSMVALEAWALGKPVLANARCDVLHGQCLRSNGGLYYAGFQEFFETLRTIDSSPALAASLGRNGRAFFERHYSWPVIERKYLDVLNDLAAASPVRTMDPLPGWWSRRRRSLPPADGVVHALPAGPHRLRPGESDSTIAAVPPKAPAPAPAVLPQRTEGRTDDWRRRDDSSRPQEPSSGDGAPTPGDRRAASSGRRAGPSGRGGNGGRGNLGRGGRGGGGGRGGSGRGGGRGGGGGRGPGGRGGNVRGGGGRGPNGGR